MRGRNRDQFTVLQYLSDGLAVGGGLLAAYWLRFLSGIDPAASVSTNYVEQFWWGFLLWMLSLHICGAIAPHPRVLSFNRARRILRACIIAVLLMAVRNYFLRTPDVARSLYPVSLLTTGTALVVNRALLQVFISRFLLTRGALSRVLIVGLGPVAFRLATRCRMQPELGYEMVGFVTLREEQVGQSVGSIPVLGTPDDIRRLIRDNGVEDVFVTQTDIPSDTFFQLFLDSERETARVHFIPSLVEMMRSTIHYDEVAGIPVYCMRETPLQGSNAAIKRAMDIAFSAAGLIVLSPFFLLVSIIIKRTSPGPAIYKQTRLGVDGMEFKIYKFRTMRPDAEQDGPGWSAPDDPRTTAIGRWLRRWNLDELPQLWNVLRGDMSLVGPRPERPYYVDRFRELFPRYMSRHSVKTGMTGWAQVHGLRGDTSIQQRLRYDLYYIENWSIWLDLKILIMTFFLNKRRRPRRVRSPFFGTPIRHETPFPMSIEESAECQTTEGSSREELLGSPVRAGASAGPSPSPSRAPER